MDGVCKNCSDGVCQNIHVINVWCGLEEYKV